MTTKAKCFALAQKHNLTIDYGFSSYSKSSSVDLPDGFTDSEGRTGLNFEVYEYSAKDFWKGVYGDIETIVINKDQWIKISESATNDLCPDCDIRMHTNTVLVLGGIPKHYQECGTCFFTAKAKEK